MGSGSKIEWTDNTFNIAHGCTKVSEGCQFCYAETWDKRKLYSKEEPQETHWGPNSGRLKLSPKYWDDPLQWNRRAERMGIKEKVFCSSMADVFEAHPDLNSERIKLWDLIENTPNLIWQLLTKRPENILKMVPASWKSTFPSNDWAMTSTENQTRFDERVKHILDVPAVVRGFSCEPLLSDIQFGNAFDDVDKSTLWIIAGGESSNNAAHVRTPHQDWFCGLRDQCLNMKIPFFFKQWGNRHESGEYTRDKSYRQLQGQEWNQFPKS
jgi:protein gp37